jgi:hypothetical protein
VVTLTGHVDQRSAAAVVAALVQRAPGVVDVIDRLTFNEDDSWRAGHSHPLRGESQGVDLS